jgi:hypothetical protein
MQTLIQKYLARGFSDFPGLTISGTIPIRQELINELIADVLLAAGADEPKEPPVPGRMPGVSPQAVLKIVKKLEVRADAGLITVEFQLRA